MPGGLGLLIIWGGGGGSVHVRVGGWSACTHVGVECAEDGVEWV